MGETLLACAFKIITGWQPVLRGSFGVPIALLIVPATRLNEPGVEHWQYQG